MKCDNCNMDVGLTANRIDIGEYKLWLCLACSEKAAVEIVEGLIPSIDREKIIPQYHHLSNEEISEIPFERIRRITGYLVGNLDRFNNAKRAEESDRVKHGTDS